MYNRYIPNGASYTRVVEEDAPPTQTVPPDAPPPEPDAEAPDAVAAFAASPVVLCGAQPARPLPATTAAVAPSPIRNERRETPADAMFFPSVLMMILPVRRCFLSAADPPPVDPLSPSCQGTGPPHQRQSGWIGKTLHSGGVEGGGTKAGREAERRCTLSS